MSNNLIEHPSNMNYLYSALCTTLIRNPSILKNGISNLTPIIQSCNHSGWTDFNNDGRRFILFFNFKLIDYLLRTPKSIGNCEVINQGGLQHNYKCPLMKSVNNKLVPIQLKDVLANPLSNIIFSEELGETGITQNRYAKQIYTALSQMISQCPIEVQMMKYDTPETYPATFNLITPDGQLTSKDVIICIIKYKKADGTDYVAHFGTGINEYSINN